MSHLDDFKDEEIKAMRQLHNDITGLMVKAMKNGMTEENAIHVAGCVAVICMKKIPRTDDGAAVLQNFMMQVGVLKGEPVTTVRH